MSASGTPSIDTRAPGLMRRAYPFVWAVVPVLGIASQNPGRFLISRMFAWCLVFLLATAIVYGLAFLVLRRRAVEVTFATVVACYLAPVAPWLAVLFGVAAVVSYCVNPARWSGASRPIALAGWILVALFSAQIVGATITARRAIGRSALVRALAAPVVGVRPTIPRDVYLIILDEYPSADVLRERWRIDNRPFEDSLRVLGFRVPHVTSNYSITLLSVASLLNFAPVESIDDAVAPMSKDYRPAGYLIAHNRSVRFLKAQGYRVEFFPSLAHVPTRTSPEADEQFDATTDVADVVYGGDLGAQLMSWTAFRATRRFLRTRSAVQAAFAARTLTGVARLATRPEPTFALAHVLLPHIPFAVDARCRPLADTTLDEHAYRGQLACTNRLTLEMVRSILANSTTPPIILLQGDHGTQSLGWANPGEIPSVAQVRERFHPFGAYYLPGERTVVPDSLQLVNLFRYVFASYFHADLPPITARALYSHWQRPYRFTDVTGLLSERPKQMSQVVSRHDDTSDSRER